MIRTSSHSYTASYLHIYFIPPLKSIREEFSTTSKEHGDPTRLWGEAWNTEWATEARGWGCPDRHFANRRSGHLPGTQPTTQALGQATRLHLLQYVYHQLQLWITPKRH